MAFTEICDKILAKKGVDFFCTIQKSGQLFRRPLFAHTYIIIYINNNLQNNKPEIQFSSQKNEEESINKSNEDDYLLEIEVKQ